MIGAAVDITIDIIETEDDMGHDSDENTNIFLPWNTRGCPGPDETNAKVAERTAYSTQNLA